MEKWQKISLTLLIIGTLVFIKTAFFPTVYQKPQIEPKEEQIPVKDEKQEKDISKSYVNIYFIGQNINKEDIYKIVKREYSTAKDGTKLNLSIKSLLQGPNEEEKAQGIYSEIPKNTRLISIEETPQKIIINLSSDFEQGGGTDGLYKRLYQIIKTANKNTTLEVYLYINGKLADIIGGEGIMINQPLNDKSLDE
jgi:spore germination protein GerM